MNVPRDEAALDQEAAKSSLKMVCPRTGQCLQPSTDALDWLPLLTFCSGMKIPCSELVAVIMDGHMQLPAADAAS